MNKNDLVLMPISMYIVVAKNCTFLITIFCTFVITGYKGMGSA